MSEFQTLYQINHALHKQGKHACTVCLTVYDWTSEHFTERGAGRLRSVCKDCRRRTGYPKDTRTYAQRKRQRMAHVMTGKA